MPIPFARALRRLLPALVLAAASTPAVGAGITRVIDNSPPPEKPHVPWYKRPLFKPRENCPACPNRYCPPYFSEIHGYTRTQWRPWTAKLPELPNSPASSEKLPDATKGKANGKDGTSPKKDMAPADGK